MKARAVTIAVTMSVLFSCSTSQRDPAEKFTATLTRVLSSSKDSAAVHHVIGIPARAITVEMEQDVRRLGVESTTHGDHLLKTRGTAKQVTELAALEWVERLDLDPEHKFDAALRLHIAKLKRSNSKESFEVIGRCSASISEEKRTELEESGARIISVIGDIFTAETTIRTLYKLAGNDAVSLLQLSGESRPN